MADPTTTPANGADSSDSALKATFAGMLPGAIKSQNADVASAKATMEKAQASVAQGTQNFEDTEHELQTQYDAALSHANDVAQRQRGITLDITKGMWKFMPIAVAFGLLASKETGGNIAAGMATMMQGLAGYANGRVEQYNTAYGQWKDAMKSAADEVKEVSSRAKQIMSDQKIDLNTRIKQLQLETTNYQVLNKAAFSNDPEKIVKAIADLDKAHAQFVKAYDGPRKKADPNISGDLLKTAMDAVTQRIPPPMGPDGKPMTAVEQSISPVYAAWKAKVAPIARQIATAAQIQVADGHTNSDAVLAVMGDFVQKGLLPSGPVTMGLETKNFQRKLPAASGSVTIGGKSYPMADIEKWAAQHNMTPDQYIAAAQAHAKQSQGK